MQEASDRRDDGPSDPSRRDLLRNVALGGAAAALGGGALLPPAPAAAQAAMGAMPMPAAAPAEAAETLQALETLNANEADVLSAVVERLIPSDGNGPGAKEGHVAHYIDRALAGPLAASRGAYAAGLAALDDHARQKKGKPFIELAAADQDTIIAEMEKNAVPGFPAAGSFFALVRTHAIQGMFSDPYYGGNAGFAGWDLVAYPGIRMPVGPEDQRLKAPPPIRKSAYDDDMFTITGGGYGH